MTALATLTRTPEGPALHIDQAAVAANVRTLCAATDAEVMAVVKADGFGHGATATARTALAHGATWLGVTHLAEAFALRTDGIAAPTLSWLNGADADFDRALRQRIDVAVPGLEHLSAVVAAARRTGVVAHVHLHLDTGLARDGAEPRLWAALCQQARRAERAGLVNVVGVMGHLPCADAATPTANNTGLTRFAWGVEVARAHGLRPRVRHLAATSAVLTDVRTHHTLVRVGAGLVGIDPSGTTALRQALMLTAPLVTVRRVRAGTGVGYGHTWIAPAATTLGLIAVGYADGLPRSASGRAEVLVRGQRRPVVGRISMDQAVVDLGGDTLAAPGEPVTLLGPGGPTIDEWAEWSGLLPHEIVTGFGPRPTRTTHTVRSL